jgi:hypothetical protein
MIAFASTAEKQIPFEDDRKKSKGKEQVLPPLASSRPG